MNNNIFSLQLFAGEDVTYNIQTTESADLSAETRTCAVRPEKTGT